MRWFEFVIGVIWNSVHVSPCHATDRHYSYYLNGRTKKKKFFHRQRNRFKFLVAVDDPGARVIIGDSIFVVDPETKVVTTSFRFENTGKNVSKQRTKEPMKCMYERKQQECQ